MEGAKAKCALRADRIGPEIPVARFLLISIYFILLPRLLEASGFLQRSDEEIIFFFRVRLLGGVTNHPSWVASCLHSKVLCTGIIARYGQHETGFKSPRLRSTVSNRLIMFL